jgi:hypothetical protein
MKVILTMFGLVFAVSTSAAKASLHHGSAARNLAFVRPSSSGVATRSFSRTSELFANPKGELCI